MSCLHTIHLNTKHARSGESIFFLHSTYIVYFMNHSTITNKPIYLPLESDLSRLVMKFIVSLSHGLLGTEIGMFSPWYLSLAAFMQLHTL